MAYVDPDYKTKKELIEAVKNGRKHYPYTPGGLFPDPQNGNVAIEGPHYPKPHRWYASGIVKDGMLISVR